MGCQHRAEGLNFTHKEIPKAITYAKKLYQADGVKRFLYYCVDLECYGLDDNIHVGQGKLSGKLKRDLNTPLVNFYAHWETFGKGTSQERRRSFVEARNRRRKIARQLPYLSWEDDGGTLHPEA